MSYDDDFADDDDEESVTKTFNSYSVLPGRVYKPIAESCNGLPAGFYDAKLTYDGIQFIRKDIDSDELVNIPGSSVEHAFADMKMFWNQRSRYEQYKLVHKRGMIFHGPPGTGKTACVMMLGALVVESGGAVIMPDNDKTFVSATEALRTSEKGRPLMFVLEELDEFLNEHEGQVLSVLDGEGSPTNSMFVATTNNLKDLADNIVKRPGRFDQVMEVPFPNDKVRMAYVVKLFKRGYNDEVEISKRATAIVSSTAGFSLAHVKEVFVASEILGEPLASVCKRFNLQS